VLRGRLVAEPIYQLRVWRPPYTGQTYLYEALAFPAKDRWHAKMGDRGRYAEPWRRAPPNAGDSWGVAHGDTPAHALNTLLATLPTTADLYLISPLLGRRPDRFGGCWLRRLQ
jgi:hypothetical protein